MSLVFGASISTEPTVGFEMVEYIFYTKMYLMKCIYTYFNRNKILYKLKDIIGVSRSSLRTSGWQIKYG